MEKLRFKISKRLSNLAEDSIIPELRSVRLHFKPNQVSENPHF